MDNNKYKELILLILKSARAELPCLGFSKELGFNFNISHRWESFSRKLYWGDFTLICNYKSWDIVEVIQNTIGKKFTHTPSSSELLTYILSIESSYEKVISIISQQKTDRLMKGDSKLTMEDLLVIIDIIYGRVERFLQALSHKVSSPNIEYSKLCAQDPRFGILKSCLNLSIYKNAHQNSTAVLAKLMQMEIKEVEMRLNILFEIKIIEKKENHYSSVDDQVDNGISTNENNRLIQNFWRKEISKFVDCREMNSPKHASAYLVYNTCPELEKKIFDLSKSYYTNLKNIVRDHSESNKDSETIRLMSMDFYTPIDNEDVLSDIY